MWFGSLGGGVSVKTTHETATTAVITTAVPSRTSGSPGAPGLVGVGWVAMRPSSMAMARMASGRALADRGGVCVPRNAEHV
jgi:hypothetical protein